MRYKNTIKRTISGAIIEIVILVMLFGCIPNRYQDISHSIISEELPVPMGEFESVAWLDEIHIAFTYKSVELASSGLNEDFGIGIFDTSTNTTEDVKPLHSVLSCDRKQGRISNLSRLPNGFLGFIYHCASSGDKLYVLDLKSNEIVKQQTYLGFTAQSYSFSPDMSQIIQENGNGGGLSEKLLLVTSDNNIQELLPDFQRARSPAWSSDGKTIAFAGTRNTTSNYENTTLQDIESLFLYPWDIYLMNADGSNPRVLLPLVGTIYGLKWSPTDRDLLLFGGNSFENVAGVWLLNVSDMGVTRIWDKNTNFDWSPDGTKIVLLDDMDEVWWRKIRVIDISK